MDLFIMKRYGGDNISEQPRKDDPLSSLLTKIDKRKKEKERLQSNEVNQTLFEEKSSECKKSKTKKRKSISDDCKIRSLEISGEFKTSEDEEVPADAIKPNSKRKKKRKKDVSNKLQSNLCEDNDVSHDCKEYETSMEDSFRDYRNETANKILHDKNEITNDTSFPAEEGENEISGFTIIGTDNFIKKKRVQRVLPHWLANPSIMSGKLKVLRRTVHDIPNLDSEIISNLEANKIKYLFPVQYEVIPWLLEANSRPLQYRPNDICVSAPTGSGKTLAYVLPIIQALKPRVVKHIGALIVLPVQELANQIFKVFKLYCHGTDLKPMLFKGKMTQEEEKNYLVKTNIITGQYNPVDIIVTTPGRLVYHLKNTPGFSLKYLRFLVIDEADRVVESIVDDWLYHVEKHIYGEIKGGPPPLNISTLHSADLPPVQKLLFSATLTQNPEKLEQLKLFQPKLFTTVMHGDREDNLGNEICGDFIGKYTTPEELTENYCVIDLAYKPLALYLLLLKEKWKTVLCFTNSKENSYRLSILLKYLSSDAFKIEALSAKLFAFKRRKVLKEFASGHIDVLICSDALARGIDIPNVDCVVSYDAPRYIETYIHRVGRTARAGNLGTALTLVTKEEEEKFKNMLNVAGKQDCLNNIVLDESLLESNEEQYREALRMLQRTLKIQERIDHQRRNKSTTKKRIKK